MNKMMKRGAMMLLGLCLLGGMTTGCCDDDPDYNDVLPPVVEVAPHTLTGMVTAISGETIAGATVTMGKESVTTDANGIYKFDGVRVGTYTIKVSAAGKRAKEGEITVENAQRSQTLIWNAVLSNDVKVEIPVSATVDTAGDVETEALKGNDLAIVDVEVVIPAGAVEVTGGNLEDVRIILSPIYSAEEGEMLSRATENLLMVGANLSVNMSGVVLKQPLEMGFNVGDEVAQHVVVKSFVNNQWVNVPHTVKDGKVWINATEFASYGLFMGITVSASKSSDKLVFAQDEWNNLYGATDMFADEAKFSYKVGTEITSQGTTVLTALLIEKLAQLFGVKSATVEGTYPLNVTLPVGTALSVSGTQQKQNVSVGALGKTVSGTTYGTVTVVASTYNRQHTGGSN